MRAAIRFSRSVRSRPSNSLDRLGDRQVHVLGNRPSLDAHRAALRLEAMPLAGRAGAQRPIGLEVLLVHPGSGLVATAEVGNQPFEVDPERILHLARLLGLDRRVIALRAPGAGAGRTEEQQIAQLAWEPAERQREIDPEGLAQGAERLAHQLPVPLGPWRDRAALEREGFVGDQPRRIEVVHRAEPLALRARAVRRVERERAWRHLGHAHAAIGARQPPREQPVAAVVGVDDDDVVGELEGDFDRFGEPALDPGLEDQAVDHHVDRVIAPPIQLDVFVERPRLSVDPQLGEAARAQRRELLLELPFAATNDRRQDVDALVVRRQQDHVDDPLERLRCDLAAAEMAMRHADVGEQQPQVVVDFRHRADGRAGVRSGGLLLDGNCRRQAVDQIDIRLLHLLEELPGIRRQRLDVAALPFRVDGVEGERGLARAGQPGQDDELIARKVDVDVLEVVDASAADRDPVVRHDYQSGIPRSSKTVSLSRRFAAWSV